MSPAGRHDRVEEFNLKITGLASNKSYAEYLVSKRLLSKIKDMPMQGIQNSGQYSDCVKLTAMVMLKIPLAF